MRFADIVFVFGLFCYIIDCSTPCGGNISTWQSTLIKSPGYSVPPYADNLDCYWRLQVSVGNLIKVKFNVFMVSLWPPFCNIYCSKGWRFGAGGGGEVVVATACPLFFRQSHWRPHWSNEKPSPRHCNSSTCYCMSPVFLHFLIPCRIYHAGKHSFVFEKYTYSVQVVVV